ncbi:GAP1-N1 domain-containing protein [Streptomyces sp. H39-C1]|uniref:GAP1-N1 domain-containing protein n=1 Tax=Streptomyces sp. H39-C1 TaxID=3004355 RepID=UPI001EF256D3|nr:MULTISPECIES: effector-associated domain EAD1-containing protein [unclassified Streptomyces]MCZ4097417.1 effector-associated domain EAD1-containing protein [Streptomyces sp. H39-C1]
MRIHAEQALFGEVRGGHALRETSGLRGLAAELAPRLDLPDTAPSGVEWSPFLSGFPHDDYYVLARTFRDPQATRAGMVLSHALIVSLNDLVSASDLRPLLARLMARPHAPLTIAPLELEFENDIPPAAADLPAAAAALVQRPAGPAVRLGHQDFDDLVVSLWARLWPAMRRNFAFRLSFGPADLVEIPTPALVCTPRSLEARWRGYKRLDTVTPVPGSLVAAALTDHEESTLLLSFADEIGAESNGFSELSLLEQAYRLTTDVPATIDSTIAAVRLVQRLSPEPTRGTSGKADLIRRLLHQLETATTDDVLTLRNLDMQGFDHAQAVWKQLATWTGDNAFPATQDMSFTTMIQDATQPSKSTRLWREAVLGGLRKAACAPGPGFARAVWRWVAADPDLLRPLWTAAEPEGELEGRLVETAPRTLPLGAAQHMIALAREGRFLRLHGVAASTAFPPCEAARLQLAIQANPFADGLELALRNATPEQIVRCSIDIGDPRMIDLAGAYASRTLTLLTNVDFSTQTAQALWAASLNYDLNAWRGPANPEAAFQSALIDLIDGRPVHDGLIGALSRTPLADLSGFSRRSELWAKLSGPDHDALIRATVQGWLEKAATGLPPFHLEPLLQTAVLSSPELDGQLGRLEAGAVVGIVTVLPAFEEDRFRRWLRTVVSSGQRIPAATWEAIGHLALDRHWRHTAGDLTVMLRYGREDIRPALRACLPIISLLDRWRHGLSAVSSAERWKALEDLAAELYPAGPNDRELWERAGGRAADLDQTGTGRTRWHQALQRIEHGSRKPRLKSLLDEMRNDYPANQSLSFFASNQKFTNER